MDNEEQIKNLEASLDKLIEYYINEYDLCATSITDILLKYARWTNAGWGAATFDADLDAWIWDDDEWSDDEEDDDDDIEDWKKAYSPIS